jgi:hypothetical protein
MLRVTGILWSRITALNKSLSMQSADAATPAPTYGTSAISRTPWSAPSSPNGPWRIGSTTSTSPSVAATAPDVAGSGTCGRERAGSETGFPPGVASTSSFDTWPEPIDQRPSRPISTGTTS